MKKNPWFSLGMALLLSLVFLLGHASKTAAQKVSKEQKLETATHGVSAMRIFYKKHYYKKYPLLFRDIVLWGIKLLEHWRKLWI